MFDSEEIGEGYRNGSSMDLSEIMSECACAEIYIHRKV